MGGYSQIPLQPEHCSNRWELVVVIYIQTTLTSAVIVLSFIYKQHSPVLSSCCYLYTNNTYQSCHRVVIYIQTTLTSAVIVLLFIYKQHLPVLSLCDIVVTTATPVDNGSHRQSSKCSVSFYQSLLQTEQQRLHAVIWWFCHCIYPTSIVIVFLTGIATATLKNEWIYKGVYLVIKHTFFFYTAWMSVCQMSVTAGNICDIISVCSNRTQLNFSLIEFELNIGLSWIAHCAEIINTEWSMNPSRLFKAKLSPATSTSETYTVRMPKTGDEPANPVSLKCFISLTSLLNTAQKP